MRLLVWAAAAVCVRALQVDDAPPFGDLSPEAQLRELRATLSDENRALMEAALEGAKAMTDDLFGPPPRRTAAATQAIQLDFSKDDPLPPIQQKYLDDAIIDSRIHFARAITNKDLEFHIDHQGYRPLHLAAQQGETDAVRDLLRLGADANARLLPSAPTGPVTVLHVAAQWGRVDIVRQLVRDGGAKIDPVEGPSSDDVKTPLVLALRHGHSNTARALIDLGADLSIISTGGSDPGIAGRSDVSDYVRDHERPRPADGRRAHVRASRSGTMVRHRRADVAVDERRARLARDRSEPHGQEAHRGTPRGAPRARRGLMS